MSAWDETSGGGVPPARESSGTEKGKGRGREGGGEGRVCQRVGEPPPRAPGAERVERGRHVAGRRGGDARRPIGRQPVVDPELDVEMVEVLVEEQVQADLEVPAVGAVDARATEGQIARRE